VGRVERVLSRVAGIEEVRVNLATERVDLLAEPSVSREILAPALEKAGYKLGEERGRRSASKGQPGRGQEADADRLRRKMAMAAVLSLPVFFLEMGGHAIPGFHAGVMRLLGHDLAFRLELVLTLGVVLGPGRDIVVHGYRTLFAAAPEMNSLVAVGTTAALGYSVVATFWPELFATISRHVYYEAASVVLTLVLVGRYLEARAKGRASEAISRLANLAPQVAIVRRGEQWLEVPSIEVRPGEQVLMKPGQRFAVDGVVLEGESRVDESMLTGEPVPVAKSLHSKVNTGTINQGGTLVFRATEIGENTLLAQIARWVEDAQATKLPIQALIDRVTFVFVPMVLGIAALSFGVWMLVRPDLGLAFALMNALSVLVIACPCAMGLATPVSILVASGRGAELGLLFRQGSALEGLAKIRAIAFDKTGTLTWGHPELTDFHPQAEFSSEALLLWLGALETRSEHPIARALVRAAELEGKGLPAVSDFQAEVGLGVSGQVEGKTIRVGSPRYLRQHGVELAPAHQILESLNGGGKTALVMAVNGQLAATLAISDPIRPEAGAAIAELQAMGLHTAMISGDSRATAQAVAQRLGIGEVVAEVLPKGKMEAVRELKAKYGMVGFVGDGINDAPVLSAADVGIAMGTGTDIAVEAAQLVLMNGDLRSVPRAFRLSRAAHKNIRQNLFWAFGYNVLLIPVAAGVLYPSHGLLLSPVFAALAMAVSSLFVVTNALRLRRFERFHLSSAASRVEDGARGASV